ncbi:MAG TPA: hypothetical protein VN874_03650 [Myxococcales bacterium]|nr:hypothetical protein [Myxococcales bacterium]
MSDRIRIIEDGIVLQDFSGVRDPDEVLQLIAEAREFMERQPRGEVLVLTDVTGLKFNQKVIDAMRSLAEHHREWLRASAVVGLTPVTRLIERAVVAITGRDHRAEGYPSESRASAIAYLLSRRASTGPSTAERAFPRKP